MLNALVSTYTAGPTAALPAPAQPTLVGPSMDPGSAVTQLLEHVQGVQDADTARFDMRLQQLDSGHLATSDLLRLQADMGEFGVRVSMTVRLADEVGRAIQTLTQRS
jgi:hypothetical protein